MRPREIRRILAGIPVLPEGDVRITPLEGGGNNRSYRIDAGSGRYVLRIADGEAPAHGADRRLEAELQQRAAQRGLAAAVVYADPGRGLLVSEFLPGRVWQTGDLGDDDRLAALAALLRRVHRLPPSGLRFDAGAAARRYLDALRAQGRAGAFARHCLEILSATPRAHDARLCHNDVVAGNVVGDTAPKLIDWEYACDNDPLFDLASLAGWHDLDDERAAALLGAYDRNASREHFARERRRFDALQWLWLAARPRAANGAPRSEKLERIRRRLA